MLRCLKIQTQNQGKIHIKIQNNSVCVCVGGGAESMWMNQIKWKGERNNGLESVR